MKCFNSDCLNQNPQQTNFCQKCGQKLLLMDRYRGLNYLGEGGFGRTFIGIDQARRNSNCVIKQFWLIGTKYAKLTISLRLKPYATRTKPVRSGLS